MRFPSCWIGALPHADNHVATPFLTSQPSWKGPDARVTLSWAESSPTGAPATWSGTSCHYSAPVFWPVYHMPRAGRPEPRPVPATLAAARDQGAGLFLPFLPRRTVGSGLCPDTNPTPSDPDHLPVAGPPPVATARLSGRHTRVLGTQTFSRLGATFNQTQRIGVRLGLFSKSSS